jgi:polyhydroxyalkanoate synthesis regulator phasin
MGPGGAYARDFAAYRAAQLAFSPMATNDRWQQYLDAGRTWTEMTRTQAETVVRDLVKQGDLQQKRAKKAVDELLERSRKNAEDLRKQVRHELQSQISALGIATQEDLARLERKLTKASSSAKSAPKKASAAKKASPSTSAAGA